MSYRDGLEDAVELCLSEVEDASDKTVALEKIRIILALVKEKKFDKLKKELGVLLTR